MRRSGWLALALLLGACPPPALTVHVSPGPVFSIFEPGRERPRYHSLAVVRGGTTVWALRAEPFGDEASTSTVRWAEVPAGFVETVPAASAVSGDYRVSVSGPLDGASRFVIDADGGVREL